jgi:predicted neuraminidase
MSTAPDNDPALQPTEINYSPGEEFASGNRKFQGIPGIAASSVSRLWATWYSGGEGEGAENYVLVSRSDDAGETWSPPLLVIQPSGMVRAFDPTLWCDPSGRLWVFWAQGLSTEVNRIWDGRGDVWYIRCDRPNEEELFWTKPRRISDGVMLNPPTVLSNGKWLFPVSIWEKAPHHLAVEGRRLAGAVCSEDQGQSFTWLGGARIPDRSFDEHHILQRGDGSLLLLARTKNGVGQSVSRDEGRTWSPGRQSGLACPNSRFFVTRLSSGNLLMVNHVDPVAMPESRSALRNHLTATISGDDGETWTGKLLLDERGDVSYPHGVQVNDGTIHVIYDRGRYGDREILLATFTEEDVFSGRTKSCVARLKHIVDRPT